jgi:hypothetical protein
MKRALVVLFCVQAALVVAQTTCPLSGTPRPESGKALVYIDFAAPPPLSVEDLLRQSSLIVDGRVVAVLPSVKT